MFSSGKGLCGLKRKTKNCFDGENHGMIGNNCHDFLVIDQVYWLHTQYERFLLHVWLWVKAEGGGGEKKRLIGVLRIVNDHILRSFACVSMVYRLLMIWLRLTLGYCSLANIFCNVLINIFMHLKEFTNFTQKTITFPVQAANKLPSHSEKFEKKKEQIQQWNLLLSVFQL